ncbi:MAG: TetR/AcrR family transcriptional regulator [Mesorhizobium sp.]|nr:TetR/AcrR family transcriptional regulator [Mesorhizobium sp.]MBL8578690.1 TetR/AcrR family transcriptional regulator [Mesorhizobium sp.]
MRSAYSRKKQPHAVRRAILDEAGRIAAEKGLAEVTIQSVATGAGVTKGGVFHHFASKQALMSAMFDDMLARIDAEIDALMVDDRGYGRFSRAYVTALTVGKFGVGSPFDAMSLSVLADAGMSRDWLAWLEGRVERHADTDDDPMLEVVRFAADGAWLTYSGTSGPRTKLHELADRLIAMTRKAG